MGIDQVKRRLFRMDKHENLVIRPPYNGGEALFIDQCTRCHECVTACETNIISIGSGGFPQVNFSDEECTFCERCSDVCPSNALDKSTYQAFDTKVTIDDKCFASNNIYCQSCRDVCDESAIKFDFFSQVIPTPTVNHDACTGCGACVSSCPQNSINITIKSEETRDE